MISFSLKRISSVGPKSCGVRSGYLRPDQFLDHLTVIKRKWKESDDAATSNHNHKRFPPQHGRSRGFFSSALTPGRPQEIRSTCWRAKRSLWLLLNNHTRYLRKFEEIWEEIILNEVRMRRRATIKVILLSSITMLIHDHLSGSHWMWIGFITQL